MDVHDCWQVFCHVLETYPTTPLPGLSTTLTKALPNLEASGVTSRAANNSMVLARGHGGAYTSDLGGAYTSDHGGTPILDHTFVPINNDSKSSDAFDFELWHELLHFDWIDDELQFLTTDKVPE